MDPRHWSITAVNLAPHQARTAMREYCEAVGGSLALTRDVVLCVSEAMTHVVLQRQDEPGIVDLDAWVDDHLCVRVRDGRTGPARPRHPDGPGLAIMRRLADHVEVGATAAGGAVICLRFALDDAAR